MRTLRAAALGAVVAVAAALLPATASAAPARAGVVLVLRPTSEAGLHTLATQRRLTPGQRHARLMALTPDARRVGAVAALARRLGLSVRSTSTWSLRADGPRSLVADLFGVLPPARAAAAGRAYPGLPALLQPYVVAALASSGRVARPLAHPATRTGSDFRSTYSAPAGGTGAGLAVATVQLSGWNANDLSEYANRHGISGFDLSKQYVAKSIDGTSTTASDGQGGDEEVALDQESILATAPGAAQVAYFASNDDGGQGYVDAVHRAGADAATYHTVALSLSWGGCEQSDDRQWIASMDQALEYAVAAGVTVFAASGDAGSQDCLGELPGAAQYAPAVDFPASSPYVVAVGGVSLPGSGSTGSTLGWSGSGGGESIYEPLPAWQVVVSSRSRTDHRLVPDIASDADPDNGFVLYDSRLHTSTNEEVLAGTSLASPTQAALLADTLQASGWTSGIGDIHSALYQGGPRGAVTDVVADQDPTIGNGDFHTGKGFDLVTGLGTPVWSTLQQWLGQFDMNVPRAVRSTTFPIRPQAPLNPGSVVYDTWSPAVVGTGADCGTATTSAPTSVSLPAASADGAYTVSIAGVTHSVPGASSGTCHVGYTRVVLDRQAPRVTASVQVSSAGVATARWSFSDPSPSSGLQKFVVAMVAGGKTQWTMTTTDRYRAFNALPFNRWHLRVTAYDIAGNATTTVAHLYDDTAFGFDRSWTRASSTAAFRRSYTGSRTVGASAKVGGIVGSSFVLYVRTCSSCGVLGVYDARGRRVAAIDTYSSSTHYRVAVRVLTLRSPSKQSLVLKVLSTKNRLSSGRAVDVDGLAVA